MATEQHTYKQADTNRTFMFTKHNVSTFDLPIKKAVPP